MKRLIKKRIMACIIDYFIIAVYALCLYGVTITIGLPEISFLAGPLIGFFTLTLPVFLYFFFFETREGHATIGKRLLRIEVESFAEHTRKSILRRNILKFLPWEIAHWGVHAITYYSYNEVITPLWVWILLILPQITMLAYLISIFISQGQQSIYDQLANTRITLLEIDEIEHKSNLPSE